MRLRRLLLLLLILPGLALGPEWSLRFCAQRLLGQAECCRSDTCCTHEGGSPQAPVAEAAGRCDRCCLDIDTQGERPVQGAEPLGSELRRAQVVALDVVAPLLAPLAPVGARPAVQAWSPAPPGRCTPLPLRI